MAIDLTKLQKELKKNPKATMLLGFDEALVGYTEEQPGKPPLAVYDFDKVTEIMCRPEEPGYIPSDLVTKGVAQAFEALRTTWNHEGSPVFIRKIL